MHSVAAPVLSELTWLVVVGSFAAWFFGSNDVANAFGTSVGAKTLTLRQAVLIAAIFEFIGAMLLGRVSTSVIAGGIADVSTFQREPEMFAYGMVCAMTVAGFWQVLASYLEYNVSSTHSIIGCIIGFSLMYGGNGAVQWQTPDPGAFPPVKGVVPIVVSWFFSPIFTGVASALLFFLLRTFILRSEHSYKLSFWLLPLLSTITVFVCMYFVFTKGAKKTISTDDDSWTDGKAAWVALIIGAGCGVLMTIIGLPILTRRANRMFNVDGSMKEDIEQDVKALETKLPLDTEEDMKTSNHDHDRDSSESDTWQETAAKAVQLMHRAVTHGTTVDIHECVEEDPMIAAIHANAERFDLKTEYVFKYLQVFSAICVEFAHGAGEVGYMAGPLAAVWHIYTEGNVDKDVTAPAWVVFIAAFGLVVGLATYGYNVTRAMGVRLAKLTATRGFCAELSTALVIMICSQYGLPTSSSQCITGGIIGVGLMEGKIGINWKFFAVQFGSWVSTLFVSGMFAAALFGQGIYSPGKVAGAAQVYYENQVATYSAAMFDNFRTTLVGYANASAAGAVPADRLSPAELFKWNQTLTDMSAAVQKAISTTQGTVGKEDLWAYMTAALSLYQSETVLTVGQLRVYPGADGVCNNDQAQDINAQVYVKCPAPQLLPKGVGATWPPQA